MTIKNILFEVLNSYSHERKKELKNNNLASKLRMDYPQHFNKLLKEYGDRYIVQGSAGQGNWADCPWIGIFDTLKTQSAQNGYYLVYLFDKKMNGVYLSLNQGVTTVKKEYKQNVKKVLATRASDFRCKLDFRPNDKIDIALNSKLINPQLYEKGNILAVYYDSTNLPDEFVLEQDFKRFLGYYQNLIAADSSDIYSYQDENIEEVKRKRLHEKFERRGNIAHMIKKKKGFVCKACGLSFTDKYGKLGTNYIEVHHLIPFSSLNEGKTNLNLKTDFTVLCSNCHRMIHRLEDPSDLQKLKNIIKEHEYISSCQQIQNYHTTEP